jgi:phage terminase large subunit GpA-like protein
MNPLVGGILDTLRPRFRESILGWVEEHVTIPHSARSTRFDRTVAPWLNEIFEAVQNDHVRQIVIAAPTGGGKTTLLECLIPFIVAAQPGPMLLTGQTDDMAKEWAESRLIPMLNACAPVAQLFPADRHAKRKTAIMFPHMALFLVGSNMSSLQEKSVRYAYGDEVWQWRPGMVGELKKRHHDRWNRKTILVSQGAEDGHEFHAEFDTGEIHEWGYVCAGCGEWRRWVWSEIHYEEHKTDAGEFDWGRIAETVRHCCGGCGHETANTTANRRAMAAASRYQAQPGNPVAGHRSYHWPAWAVWWVDWADLVREWLAANHAKRRGVIDDLRQFTQKRAAERWKVDQSAPDVELVAADYSLTQFMNGQTIDGEVHRFQTVDVQQDHFWSVIRAWRADGSSRLLWEGRIALVDMVRELQQRYSVKPQCLFIDTGYMAGPVYDWCAKFGWTGIKGEGAHGIKVNGVQRLYSNLQPTQAPSGGAAKYFIWANEGIKDALAKLRAAGAPMWEFPRDVSSEYLAQLNSEMKRETLDKRTKKMALRWMKIGSRANHLWDCEAMQVAVATMFRLLRVDTPAET